MQGIPLGYVLSKQDWAFPKWPGYTSPWGPPLLLAFWEFPGGLGTLSEPLGKEFGKRPGNRTLLALLLSGHRPAGLSGCWERLGADTKVGTKGGPAVAGGL